MTNSFKAIFYFLIFIISFTSSSSLKAQAVWEQHQSEVYNYLARMAQKGFIVFDDLIRPLSRSEIKKNLLSLNEQPEKLSSIEKKELDFYLEEYLSSIDSILTNKTPVDFFKKDIYGRWRSFSASSNDVLINADPVIGISHTSGSGKSFTQKDIGLQFWGTIGKHVGFQFYGKDVTEQGTGLNRRESNNETGIVLQSDTINHRTQNYSELRASISYQWKNGMVSVGQEYLTWGYGINGRIVLSDKSPAYPQVRLDYRIFPWLKFNYVHAFLHSNIADTLWNYPFGNITFGGKRVSYVQKFMASHSLDITLTKKLNVSLGENMIYADRLNIGYIIPIMFFKVYDNIQSHNNISAGGNGQFFFSLSARNLVPKTHFYSTLFIDEIKIAALFNKEKRRNQLGYNIGASVTDAGIQYLTFSAEYTKVNPFVYRNLNPVENYTSHSYPLGDWMGNNFDRLIFSADYTPVAKLKLQAQYQHIRKGSMGTIDQQYLAQPQPPFLFNKIYNETRYYFHASYQWIHQLYIQASMARSAKQIVATQNKNTDNTFTFGLLYGL